MALFPVFWTILRTDSRRIGVLWFNQRGACPKTRRRLTLLDVQSRLIHSFPEFLAAVIRRKFVTLLLRGSRCLPLTPTTSFHRQPSPPNPFLTYFLLDELFLLTSVGRNLALSVSPCWFGPGGIPPSSLRNEACGSAMGWLIKRKTLLAMCALPRPGFTSTIRTTSLLWRKTWWRWSQRKHGRRDHSGFQIESVFSVSLSLNPLITNVRLQGLKHKRVIW